MAVKRTGQLGFVDAPTPVGAGRNDRLDRPSVWWAGIGSS
jgi:hypothetical protein